MHKKIIVLALIMVILTSCNEGIPQSTLESSNTTTQAKSPESSESKNTTTSNSMLNSSNISNGAKKVAEFKIENAENKNDGLRENIRSKSNDYYKKTDKEVIFSREDIIVKDSIVYKTIEFYSINIPKGIETPLSDDKIGEFISQFPYKTEIWASNINDDTKEILFSQEAVDVNYIEVMGDFLYFAVQERTENLGFDWRFYKYDLKSGEKEIIAENNGDTSKPQLPNVFYSDKYILFDEYYNSSLQTAESSIERKTKLYDIKTKEIRELNLENRYGKSPYMGIDVKGDKVYYISKIDNQETIDVHSLIDDSKLFSLVLPLGLEVSNVAAIENSTGEWIFFGDGMTSHLLYGYNITKDYSCLLTNDLFSFRTRDNLEIKTNDFKEWIYSTI